MATWGSSGGSSEMWLPGGEKPSKLLSSPPSPPSSLSSPTSLPPAPSSLSSATYRRFRVGALPR
jgi:hypothetical protein